MRVVIVDDEPLARRGIRQLLAPHVDVEVAGEARNGREAVRVLRALAPDLVFLDVQMPEMDGFEVLRQLGAGPLPAVVFVTAFDRFAVQAFESHALDYLVKPLNAARFEDTLARVRERLHTHAVAELSAQLAAMLALPDGVQRAGAPARPAARRVMFLTGNAELVLDQKEIAWIEADDDYAAVHAGGRRHLVRESLASLEERLDRLRFVRVHRSALVNLEHVRAIRGASLRSCRVLLRDGTELPLSRRRRGQVAEAMRRFAG